MSWFQLRRTLGRCLSSTATTSGAPKVTAPKFPIPAPTAFLGTIKRGCEQYVGKIPSWEALFTMKSKNMEKAGIPCQARKRILNWVNKYRMGVEPYYIGPSIKLKKKAKEKAKAAAAGKK